MAHNNNSNNHTPKHTALWWRRTGALVCVLALTLPVIMESIAADRKIKPRSPHVNITPTVPTANRHQDGKVFLEHSDLLHYEQQPTEANSDEQPEQYQVLNGNVVMRKGDMFMYCDSAYFYEESNSFDAFGNVRMEQGDTLFVYADELNYDGASELAILYADLGKKVRLINKEVKLETDVFNYDMQNEVGYYTNGGVLTDKQNKLTSVAGEYHPDTKDAYFNYNVHLRSLQNADTLHIYTDSLEYNTDTHLARIISKSEIVNKDGVIYSTRNIQYQHRDRRPLQALRGCDQKRKHTYRRHPVLRPHQRFWRSLWRSHSNRLSKTSVTAR